MTPPNAHHRHVATLRSLVCAKSTAVHAAKALPEHDGASDGTSDTPALTYPSRSTLLVDWLCSTLCFEWAHTRPVSATTASTIVTGFSRGVHWGPPCTNRSKLPSW